MEFISQEGKKFNSLVDLVNNELITMGEPPLSPEEMGNAGMEDLEDQDFAHWVVKGNNYLPAPDTKTVTSIPSGVYKIADSQEGFVVIPQEVTADELFQFSEDFTSEIIDEMKSFWDKKEIYKKNNLTHKRGILLCGGPGSGKTSIINLLIKQIIEENGIVFLVNNTQDFDMLSCCIKPIIRKIEKERPIITIIEDVNQLIAEWGGNDYRLLDFMDGKSSIDNHLIVLTSNDTTDFSDALLRPSRIDLTYEVLNPSSRVRREYYEHKGISADRLDEYVEKTEGLSFAQMKEVFIGVEVQGKDISSVVSRVLEPFESRDYLGKSKTMKGIE